MIVTSSLCGREQRHLLSINDYSNDEDVEAALYESFRGLNSMKHQEQEQESVDPSCIPESFEEKKAIPQRVERELRRLKSLKSFQVLDAYPTAPPSSDSTPPTPSTPQNESSPAAPAEHPSSDLDATLSTMNRLVHMATRLLDVPVAVISLTDLGRQNILASKGLPGDVQELPRMNSPCGQTVASKEDAHVIPDITLEPHVRQLVTSLVEDARFYAGVPLISPEGERIGAMCILDTKPHPGGLKTEDLQDLKHCAGLAMQALVERRSRLQLTRKLQKATRVVSAAVHDLLTPLTAVELALSLLHEDQDFQGKLSNHQKESVKIASNCIGVLGRMCRRMRDQQSANCKNQMHESIMKAANFSATDTNDEPVPACLHLHSADFGLTAGSFRIMYGTGQPHMDDSEDRGDDSSSKFEKKVLAAPQVTVVVQDLVKSIHMAMNAIPRTVPIVVALHASVPSQIVLDDLKVLRSALNLLQHCASISNSGSIQLKIQPQYCRCGKAMLGFYCQNQLEGTKHAGVTTGTEQCIRDCCSIVPIPAQDLENRASSSDLETSSSYMEQDCCHKHGTTTKSLRNSSEINLYSVAMLVDALGGDCGIDTHESRDGQEQTSFWFRIPLEEPVRPSSTKERPDIEEKQASLDKLDSLLVDPSTCSRDAAKDKAPEVPEASSNDVALVLETQPRKRRALIIEDSIVIRKVIANALSKIGIEAEMAVNGMEGLHLLQASLYDVVLCDFLMPVMDGFDCVQQYRQWEKTNRPSIRQYIIGMSAHASDQDVGRGLRAGMDSYKPKPLTYKGLKDLVDACEKNQQNVISQSLDSTNEDALKSSVNKRNMLNAGNREQPKMCLIASKDDSYDLARLTEARGWKSLIVRDGDDALQSLKKRNWDAVLLDEKLPILSGTKCVAEFREWEKENRVNSQANVYITGGNDSPTRLPAGVHGILRKPVRPRDFEKLLEKAEEPSLNIIMR